MHVATGTRLGPYEVVGPLGSGGMGEVWEARDTRLGRAVAIKVLPAELAQNAQLKIRFDREAKTISQLNHPHICTLYDVGDGYLVMELLEGESLAERLAKGALPVADALRIGAQIAEALDRAHRAGVVHRDLKPGNIMLTKSGAKLLDFGLAKSDAGGPLQIDGATQQKSLTQEGTILGTFQYMAPEQLEGLEADARTDIFALGAVLYEMVTGKRAFQGTSKTSLIAAIVSAEPQPINAMQPLTPPAFEHVVRKCLAKDREARWQSAYDVAEELRWIGEAGSQAGVASPILASKRQRQRNVWLLAMLAVAAIAAAAGWLASSRWTNAHARKPVYRLTIPTPPGSVLGYAQGRMALSPDGQRLAFASYGRLMNGLLVRELRETTWRPLDGTSGAIAPFWSPDGRQLAYFARGALWKIGADGSAAPEEVARVPGIGRAPSGTWSREGTILFAAGGKLFKVNASGGDPVELVKAKKLGAVQDPDFLSDGQRFIATSIDAKANRNVHFVGSLDPNQEPIPVLNGNNNALYCDGYLFYVRSGTLYAQRFDEKKLRLSGESKAITKVLGFDPNPAYFAVAGDALVYLPQGSEVRTELQRVDRTGKAIATIGQPAFYFSPRISHDGTRIATDQSGTNGSGDIWIISAANGSATRLTFAPENESAPVWSPDDSEVAYFINTDVAFSIMRKRIAGGQPVTAYKGSALTFSADWSSDNKWLLIMSTQSLDAELQVVPLSMPDLKPAAPVAVGHAPHFSPDGRWVAYTTWEREGAGQEIFVQPFPPNGSKWQISSEGGSMPVWARDGKSLFFLGATGQIMQVSVGSSADGSFVSQVPQALFPVALREGGALFAQYDVFPDGTFLLNRIPDNATTPMTVVLNWKETLEH